jgi:hypothetical protein
MRGEGAGFTPGGLHSFTPSAAAIYNQAGDDYVSYADGEPAVCAAG